MDGFSLAQYICSCTDEPISYNGIPKALIGPYFPNETLTADKFLQFKLPSFQTNLQTTPTCLGHCPPSIKELTKHELQSTPCPPCPVMNQSPNMILTMPTPSFYWNQHTVTQKTIPMFGCFELLSVLWKTLEFKSSDISHKGRNIFHLVTCRKCKQSVENWAPRRGKNRPRSLEWFFCWCFSSQYCVVVSPDIVL